MINFPSVWISSLCNFHSEGLLNTMCAGLLKSDTKLDVEEVYDWMVLLLHFGFNYSLRSKLLVTDLTICDK
jgi:hypothetical protein